MSFLLKNRGGSNKGPSTTANRSSKRNALGSAHRRGGGGQSCRNPSSSHGNGHSNTRFSSSSSVGSSDHPHTYANNNHHATNSQQYSGVAVVNNDGGQVQLQRMAPHVQGKQQNQSPQQQNRGVSQQERQQGVVSMDEVFADLQILEQQRQESKRHVASIQLTKKQKLEQKYALESKLCELKRQNGGMRVEIQCASKQLSLRHRELLEAQSRSDNSRKATNRFDSKLKRVIGVARHLGAYQNNIENAMIALNETETRLNFSKGQTTSKLQSAMVRCDDAKHRHELLLKAINFSTTKERSIAEDISKIRSEISSNEQDLSAAQQMESQTRLRVETIEHETSKERNRHMDTVTDLESKSKEINKSNANTTQSIENMKVELEIKKAELHRIWEKCVGLRKSEGHPEPDEPKWGMEQASSLDVARVRVRVNAQEMQLNSKRDQSETLHKDISDLEGFVVSIAAEAVEKRAEADSLIKECGKICAKEGLRKEDIIKAASQANLECQEVEKLRESIAELTEEKEINAAEVQRKLDGEENNVSAMEVNVASAINELSSVKRQSVEHKAHVGDTLKKISDEIASAKTVADLVKTAFERAQRAANDFRSLPDEELAIQTNQLNEAEQDIISDANCERDEIIEMEPLLGKLKLHFNSDVSLEEQKEAGMNSLKNHCEDFIEAARAERKVRIDHAREIHLERLAAIKKQEEEETRLRIQQQEEARIEQEEAAAEQKLKEEEEERLLEEERADQVKRRKEREAEAEQKLEEDAAAREKQVEEGAHSRLKEEEEAIHRRLKREEEAAARQKREKDEDEMRQEEERSAAAEEEARCRKERVAKLAKNRLEEAAARQCEEDEEVKRLEEEMAVAKEEEARRRKERVAKLGKKREEEAAARQREEEEEIKRLEEEMTIAKEEEARRRKERIAKLVKKKEEEAAARQHEEEEAESRLEEERTAAKDLKAAGVGRREERAATVRQKKEEAADRRRQREKEKAAAAKKEGERGRRSEERPVLKAGTEREKRRQERDAPEKCRESEKRRQEREASEKRRIEKLEAMRGSGKVMQERLKKEEEKSICKEHHRHKEKEDVNQRARPANHGKDKEALKPRNKASKLDETRSRSEPTEAALKTRRSESSDTRKRVKSSDSVVSSRSKDAAHKRKRAKSSDSVVSSKSKDAGHKRAKSSDTVTSSKSKRDLSIKTKSAIRHKDQKRPKLSTGASVRFDQTANRPKMDIFSNKITKTKPSRSKQTSNLSTSEGGVPSRRRKKAFVGGKSKAKVLAMNNYEDDGGFM